MTAALHVGFVSGLVLLAFAWCLDNATAQREGPRLVGMAVALPLIAWVLPDLRLLFAAMLLCVPVVAGRTDRIAPVYVFALLLLPGLDTPVTIGATKLFDFGVHDAMGLGAAAALMLNGNRARPRVAFDLAAVGIILLLGAALSRGTTPTHFLRVAINIVLDLGLPYYVLSRGIASMEDMGEALLWLAAGAVVLSGILLYEAAQAWPIYYPLYQHYQVPIGYFVKSRGGILRAAGPFLESTATAFVMAICVLALWLARDRFRSKWHHLLMFGFAVLGLLAPQSRGAWSGLFLAIILTMAHNGQYLRIIRTGVIVAGVGLALVVAAQSSPSLSETLGLSGSSSDSAVYRETLLARGIEELHASPVVGFALADIMDRLEDLRQGEGIIDFVNAYLWVALISGLAGLALFLSCYGLFVLHAVRLRRWATGDTRRLAASGFVIGALVMSAMMLAFTAFNARPAVFVFVLFGAVAALVAIRDRERRPRRSVAPPKIYTKWAWRRM